MLVSDDVLPINHLTLLHTPSLFLCLSHSLSISLSLCCGFLSFTLSLSLALSLSLSLSVSVKFSFPFLNFFLALNYFLSHQWHSHSLPLSPLLSIGLSLPFVLSFFSSLFILFIPFSSLSLPSCPGPLSLLHTLSALLSFHPSSFLLYFSLSLFPSLFLPFRFSLSLVSLAPSLVAALIPQRRRRKACHGV